MDQGSLWKKTQEDCKNQKNKEFAVRLYLLEDTPTHISRTWRSKHELNKVKQHHRATALGSPTSCTNEESSINEQWPPEPNLCPIVTNKTPVDTLSIQHQNSLLAVAGEAEIGLSASFSQAGSLNICHFLLAPTKWLEVQSYSVVTLSWNQTLM